VLPATTPDSATDFFGFGPAGVDRGSFIVPFLFFSGEQRTEALFIGVVSEL
jgi:hypothetical protein